MHLPENKLDQEKQAQENAARAICECESRTPIYHLGLVAGYLARLVEAAPLRSNLKR